MISMFFALGRRNCSPAHGKGCNSAEPMLEKLPAAEASMFERATMESDSFIFDDDIEEIGSDVEAFCPKCKADTAHTIITKYEEEIRRVQCSPCGDVHAYRKPRGEIEDEAAQEEKNKKK